MLAKLRSEKGLTQLEIVVILIVLAILATIFGVKYVSMAATARHSKCLENQAAHSAAAKLLYAENALSGTPAFPATLADLEPKMARNYTDQCSNNDGTNLQYDNATGDVTCPNHAKN